MIGRLFRAHGEFCASHPWEVIVALLTATACMLTVDKGNEGRILFTASARHRPCQGWRDSCEGVEAEYNAVDVILMTIVRCSAVLYCYYQFCSLHKLGSKYILGVIAITLFFLLTAKNDETRFRHVIEKSYPVKNSYMKNSRDLEEIKGIAGLFTVFSSFIFTTSIIKVLGFDISDLKDALFFLLLLIDLSNSATLAQFALTGTSQEEVTTNIARGMELLGPAITLDTLVETLVIGVGTLSGVQRLEMLCTYAVMSVVVNYIVFMTFYPACLSLILDLSRNGMDMSVVKTKAKDSILMKALNEDEQKNNPVVQRVKVIMSTGLMIVHVYSRLFLSEKETSDISNSISAKLQQQNLNNGTDTVEITDYLIKWLTMSADQIVILILLLALVVKFIFFENREEIRDQIRLSSTKPLPNIVVSPTQYHQIEKVEVAYSKPMFTIEETNFTNRSTQTDTEWNEDEAQDCADRSDLIFESPREPRSLPECLEILNSEEGAANLTDEEITLVVKAGGGHCPLYKIESVINNPERGVKIRRKIISAEANLPLEKLESLPYQRFDYTKVMNACCENVLGYVPIPVGYAGPLLLDGKKYFIPMATTEGALVASTNRGCKALSIRGVRSYVEDIGMTRAPCVKFPSVSRAAEAKKWINAEENYKQIKAEFDSTSRFGRLREILIAMDGPQLYIRFVALTGDAMGMNMVSKGAEMALKFIKIEFPDMQIISLSGNFCSDKKPAAINWIKGRGKRVITECIVPAATLKQILKTEAKVLVDCNKMKNMTGSALAGSIGGNNAHAANMVTAVFIATGQDPAQNVTSSNCSTGMELWGENDDDLYMTCTMPSLEVGTVGGGTGLPGQSACLDMLGVRGANAKTPGENARRLAQIICATVMAGELSLMAALVNSDLVKSHMRHNRSSVAVSTGIVESSSSITLKPPSNTS